jgi:hypothetical protein
VRMLADGSWCGVDVGVGVKLSTVCLKVYTKY